LGISKKSDINAKKKNIAKIRYVPLLIPIAFIGRPKFYGIMPMQ